jgi:uncharacterized protein HemY
MCVCDWELYDTWAAMDEAGRHDENLRMLNRVLAAQPDDPDLYLLRARTLLSMEKHSASLDAVHDAIARGRDSAEVLTKAGSMCFYAGDVATARWCVGRAKVLAPRRFVLKEDLAELDRNVSRREKGRETEERLTGAFEADPARLGVAADLARHLARNGQTYAAYHAVARGLRFHPDDRVLRRLAKRLRKVVPDDVRAEAEAWAASDKPFVVS